MKIYKFLLKKFYLYCKLYNLKKTNVRIGKKTNIENTKFESYIKIYNNCNISNSYIGIGTYISHNAILPNSKIGRFCSIGPNVTIAIGNHPCSTFVSTHPAFFSTLKQAGFTFTSENIFKELSYIDEKYFVKIGNDVWIGANVTILNGISIGDGAIIGAGAVVTKNIEPYTINTGVPSKPTRKRFTENEIVFLDKFKWWEKDFEWIKKNAYLFKNIGLLNNLNE